MKNRERAQTLFSSNIVSLREKFFLLSTRKFAIHWDDGIINGETKLFLLQSNRVEEIQKVAWETKGNRQREINGK